MSSNCIGSERDGRTGEVEAFLGEMLPRQRDAEQALCHGDAAARTATWSRNDPVTLFGAAVPLRRGWDEVDETFHWLAGRFAGKQLRDYDLELVAAGALRGPRLHRGLRAQDVRRRR